MVFPFLESLEDLLSVGKELFAFVRQMNLFTQTVEQPAVELPLQRLDACGHRRLGQKQDVCRLIEAAVVMDVDKSLDIFDVQANTSGNIIYLLFQ